ncbi:hypothetical protein KP004_06105 [Geomonas oryzisoli]|uniref:Uncharacterized protein n=1 Tax=Geomonas oryzisoli TaxID=2847992 RepID=A0ABX8J8H2_9BACT|nr:hypothetical protein [Geomonas oryzisoli]QWV94748.1 hypothetical protein KP004_06105 [Geomonas oryzisoli]
MRRRYHRGKCAVNGFFALAPWQSIAAMKKDGKVKPFAPANRAAAGFLPVRCRC